MESNKPETNNNSNISNNINDNQDEQSKSEDDFLGYSSQYNTSNHIDEKNDKESKIQKKEIDVRRRKYSDEPGFISHNYKKNFILKSEIQVYRKNSDLNMNKGFIDFFEEENKKNFERKMSTPLYSYFDGSDKFMKKLHQHTIDLNNSNNFIKKEDLLNQNHIDRNNVNVPNELNIINNPVNNNNFYNFINNNHVNDCSNNINDINNINNINCIQNDNQNNNIINDDSSNNNIRHLTFQQIAYEMNLLRGGQYIGIPNLQNLSQNNMNNTENNNTNGYKDFSNYQQQNLRNFLGNSENISKRKLSYGKEDGIISQYFNNLLNANVPPNINNINNYCQNHNNFNNMLFSYNEDQGENFQQINKVNSNKFIKNLKIPAEKKTLDKRKGDWLCPECGNLNFAFRVKCNRCHIQKPPNAIITQQDDA